MAQTPKNSPLPRLSLQELRLKRDASWKTEARNLYCALMLLGKVTKAHNVLECGHAFIRFHCRDCRSDTDVKLSCHLRLCPRCAVRRSMKWIAKHTLALQSITEPTLLTLTFKSVQHLTPETVDFAFACFAKLRRTKLWKTAVRGGMAGLELTWSLKGWHLHFHALLDSSWMSRKPLSVAWKRITQDAWLVDIRRCDVFGGVHEVAKYITKGSTFYAHPHLLQQFLDVTFRRRFFSTFGSFFSLKDPKPLPTPKPPPANIITAGNHIPPATPLISACSQCGGVHLVLMGKVLEDPLEPPSIQLPF